MSVRVQRSNGLQLTGRLGVARPSRGAEAPHHWRKYANFLLTLIEGQPDLTLDEVVSAMRKHKIPGSRTAVWRFFQRHTFKKTYGAPRSQVVFDAMV